MASVRWLKGLVLGIALGMVGAGAAAEEETRPNVLLIIPDQHMYARTEAGPWVLYDLEKDPDELKNLAQDAGAQAVRTELEARLAKWMKDTGDSWRFNSTVPVEDKGRLYRFESF
jgi:sulfite reductase beta subunit-like hemoprotein